MKFICKQFHLKQWFDDNTLARCVPIHPRSWDFDSNYAVTGSSSPKMDRWQVIVWTVKKDIIYYEMLNSEKKCYQSRDWDERLIEERCENNKIKKKREHVETILYLILLVRHGEPHPPRAFPCNLLMTSGDNFLRQHWKQSGFRINTRIDQRRFLALICSKTSQTRARKSWLSKTSGNWII